MRIPIFYDRGRPPYVIAKVNWDLRGASAPVDLVVDTGASDLFLSMRDVAALDPGMHCLSPSRMRVHGIGGSVNTFEMRGVSVTFMGEEMREVEVDLGSATVLGTGEQRTVRRSMGHVPSIMGRKFMADNGFVLHWDFPREVAFIDIVEFTARTNCRDGGRATEGSCEARRTRRYRDIAAKASQPSGRRLRWRR